MPADRLQLQVLFNAVDRVTAPLRQIQQASRVTSTDLQRSQQTLRTLQQQQARVDSFRQLSRETRNLGQQQQQAQQRAAALARQLAATAAPSDTLRREQQQAVSTAQALARQHQTLTQRLATERSTLAAAGINTRNLVQDQQALRSRTTEAGRAVQQQTEALRRNAEARARADRARQAYERTNEFRDNLGKNAAGLLGVGTAIAGVLAVPVKAFAESENAAVGLQVAMMQANGQVQDTFASVNTLAESLGNKLPGSTADFQNMMTMLIRQGMSVKAILGGVGQASAYLAVQMQMAPTAAAEFAAKMQDATKTTEAEMMGLMDVIQKSYYLGVDSGNMLQGFSKIAPALDIIKKQGLEGAKALAPLLIMSDAAGMAGESAGNAYRKIFAAGLDAEKLQKANGIDISSLGGADKHKVKKVNKSFGLNLDFSNGKGEFGGLENLFKQLEKIKALSTQKRIEVIKALFGDDAEVATTVSMLMEKGLAGYRETQAKMAAQADLQARVAAQLGTLKNLWDAATGTAQNAFAAFGEVLAPDIKDLVNLIGSLAEKIQGWAKANPETAKTMMRIAAVVALVSVTVGGLGLALAAVVVPFAMLRYFGGMALTPLVGLIRAAPLLASSLGLVGNTIRAVGMALVTSPIGWLLIAIAAAAYLIWRNWDTLGPKFARLWDSITSTLRGAWEGAIDWLSRLPERFFDCGGAVIDGLINGIQSRAKALRDSISTAAGDAADAFKARLGINSPSRVFAQFGVYSMQGYAQGVTAANDLPLAAVKRVSDAVARHTADTPNPVASAGRAPAAAAAAGQGSASNVYHITINAPGGHPQEIARAVQDALRQAHQQSAVRARSRYAESEAA